MNLCVLTGRLVRDVESRKTNSGETVVNFTLAVNRNYKGADGVTADFLPCQCWGKLAENVEKYCAKGSHVAVQGSIRTRSYENKEGNKVNVTEIICSSVEFLETKQSREKDTNRAKIDDLFEVEHSSAKADVFDIEF